jgi:NDP-sugar pyrophosphorylase family protein
VKFFLLDVINPMMLSHVLLPMHNKHLTSPFGILIIKNNINLNRFSFRYLQEYASLGTGGGIYHFRDLIKSNISDKDAFFVINGDICADLPLVEMLQFHRENVGDKGFTILGTEVH